MNEFILNERTFVENTLKSGKIDTKKPGRTLGIMATYFYEVGGYRKKKIAELLIDFMKKNYPGYEKNSDKINELCEKIARTTGGDKLFNVDGISITKSELDTIASIKNRKQENLLFVMLAIAKFNDAKKAVNNGWVNTSTMDLFKIAKVNCRNAKERELMIHELVKAGLVEVPKKADKINYRITFVDHFGNAVIVINDYRELLNEYYAYLSPNLYFRCKTCGRLTRKNDNNFKTHICNVCENPKKQTLKSVVCVDCGKEFKVDSRITNKCRCDACQNKRNRALQTHRRSGKN